MNISDILGIPQSDVLFEKVRLAVANFNQLDLAKNYHLAFSGGKDSHALLVVYLLWKKMFNPKIKLTIKFSDTRLESDLIYQSIKNIENQLNGKELFERTYPVNNYWFYQFVIGYPVPDYRVRWCTSELKIKPMSHNKSISITGRHYGESEERDKKLKLDNCSSGECGIDRIKKSFDPILHFRNCDVWDLIFYADGKLLYEGVFRQLKKTYSQTQSEVGSLRMGCFMCPVIGINTLRIDQSRQHGMSIRLTLEKLRGSRRLKSPRTGKNGAIYIEDRRTIWRELDKEILLKFGYITEIEIKEIDKLIQLDSYPKTYSQEWIKSEHERINKEPIQLALTLTI
jgi:3'-phosphoadenosine 5'-phosphosulfate sulfotransferase (PAPS reductase)/FAD synthetase